MIDERRGRRAATRLGCRVVGVLGVLIEAKRHGHLPVVRPVLDSLTEEAGFRVSEVLKERVLAVVAAESVEWPGEIERRIFF